MELHLLGKKVYPAQSELLLKSAVNENWARDWRVLAGNWQWIDDRLHGWETGNQGGILMSRERFDGDVMLVCRMAAVPPATRDLNVLFCADWNEAGDYISRGYIAGFNGWYEEKCGIERFPENGLNATNPLYRIAAGREIELMAGAIGGHCFLAADGQLVQELIDPAPLRGGRVGFSPYCTHLAICDIEVRRIAWEPFEQSYAPEFSPLA